jgi:hypothetical protein
MRRSRVERGNAGEGQMPEKDMTEKDKVLSANLEFYRAFITRDAARNEPAMGARAHGIRLETASARTSLSLWPSVDGR